MWLFYKNLIYSYDREGERAQAGGTAEGEEAGFPLRQGAHCPCGARSQDSGNMTRAGGRCIMD